MAPEYLRYDTKKYLAAYKEFSRTVLDPRGKGERKYVREPVGKAFRNAETVWRLPQVQHMVVAVSRKP